MIKRYTLMQIISSWSDVLGAWEETDRIFVGELMLPANLPVESQSMSEFLSKEDLPVRISTSLNDYGHRVIDVETDDGQPLYSMVAQSQEGD